MNDTYAVLFQAWRELYPGQSEVPLVNLIEDLERFKSGLSLEPLQKEWYKEAVVYSLYVDLFNKDFRGLTEKLDYLQDLGVNCLWLLPILDSPMRDAGFDISDYRKIRPELSGLGTGATPEQLDRIFRQFLDEAHKRGLKVIFDIATNHISDQHPWFREAILSNDNPYHDFFIWSKDDKGYPDARIIFYGIEESNWKKQGDEYYFHRFFDFQPDLNYRNPRVLIEMSKNLLFWIERGVDGFRADAIPYIWKEEGTPCENHPKTHTIVKFFRGVLEAVRPGMLLLAEACQKPYEVVKYFGNGDECNAGYHFPLMPQMFKALAQGNREPVYNTLSPAVTPAIPPSAQWFTFLRCHDELSLELVYVTEEDRKYIHEHYCRQPQWDFRLGQGISARLSELMDRDPARIGLIFSVMLTLPGTPVVYYGDEFGKLNDEDYYREMIRTVGKDDTRFLVRGKIDWDFVEKELADHHSFSYQVNSRVKSMLKARNELRVFGKGDITWIDMKNADGKSATQVMAFIRSVEGRIALIIHNLSTEEIKLKWDYPSSTIIAGEYPVTENGLILLKPYAYHWFSL
jgi:maltose alpha-D-glucosyltransferase / alpha-amylase